MDENNNGVNYGPDPINNGGYSSNPNPNQQPPVYNTADPALDPGKGMATGALVCGILGLCCCGVCNIVAIVLGAMARGKCTTDSNRKKATAGLVLGIIGLVISIVSSILYIATGAFNEISSSSSYYYGY